jgi:Undecaprenyl-phosphate glucose phosphotransferase
MSSSPILDLGIVSGAAGSHRPVRQQAGMVVEDLDASTVSRMAPLRGDSERAFGLAGADSPPASNVVELETPQFRRTGVLDRAPSDPRSRINPRAVALAVRVSDALVVAAAGAVAYRLQPSFHWPLDPTTAFTALAVMAMLVRFPGAEPRLLHDSQRRPLSRQLADGALRTLVPFILSVLVVIALVPADHISRAPLTHWLTMWAMGAVPGICGVRLCLSGLIAHWRSQGRLKQRVAIFGTGDLAERLLEHLRVSCTNSIELVGVFDDRARRRIASPGMRSLALGTADDLIALSRHRDIDRVLVALPHSAEHRVVAVLKKLRHMPVEISLAPDLIGYNIPCRDADSHPGELGGLPLVEVYGRPLTFGQLLLKGLIDRTLATAALILGAPLFLALAIAVKLDSKGPVFFRQNRDGFGDRVIGVHKFRTMCVDATDCNGEFQARPNDPRVTRVGHFLRRWSLDELPQLVNVLRGEMALVGPRPHAVSMRVEERPNRDIVPDYALRHHVKPGITGWAQVNGYHGPVATEEALRARVRYDLDYINNWSFWFDFQILLRTLKIVFGQRRAY